VLFPSADNLRARGVQVTAQRLAVLRAIHACPHGSVEAIELHVRGELGTVSTQAVYDTLHLFCEHGLARRVLLPGHPARFDPRADDSHHHAVCRLCGRITDVECAAGTAPCLSAATNCGYRIDAVEIVYWGTCSACRPNPRPRRNSTGKR
jgi:Fe2+ or Zn2+ uptake regulation protein